MTFENKTIWITGASSGIGEALTFQLAKQNCKLIISSRRETVLNEVKNKCQQPENIKVLPLDLADYKSLPTIVEKAIKLFGKVDILINNGGISHRSLIIDTAIEVDKKLMEIDYLGTVALSKALLPHFIAQKSGHFVNFVACRSPFRL